MLSAAALLIGSNAYAQQRRQFAPTPPGASVTVCELVRNPDLYHGKIVRVVGVGYGLPGGAFKLSDDEEAESRCGADGAVAVRPVRTSGMNRPFEASAEKAGDASTRHTRVKARVEVVGKFDKGVDGLTDCFGPRFSIEAGAVRRLSPATPLFLE